MDYKIRLVTTGDYDSLYALWNSTEQSRRALNPVDDSSLAYSEECGGEKEKVIGVILAGHDGRRAIIHHMCVDPGCRRRGIAGALVQKAEEALKKEGISKVFGLVFRDNDAANEFWENQGYSVRTNLNYRNKSLNAAVPEGE